MVKILSLNIWNYNGFKERKPKIIAFIKRNKPDIVVLQEVRDDLQFNRKGDNQAKQLNDGLGYPHFVFYPVRDKRKERPGKYKLRCMEGIAVLSRFPITRTEKKRLRKHKDDRYYRGNLYFRVKAEKSIDFIAVHFSLDDRFGLPHLAETLRFAKRKRIRPILVGDFNIGDPDALHDLTMDEYRSSLQEKKYVSRPGKGLTIDYILIPKVYRFRSFRCSSANISDHRALIADIIV